MLVRRVWYRPKRSKYLRQTRGNKRVNLAPGCSVAISDSRTDQSVASPKLFHKIKHRQTTNRDSTSHRRHCGCETLRKIATMTNPGSLEQCIEVEWKMRSSLHHYRDFFLNASHFRTLSLMILICVDGSSSPFHSETL